jgi:hypothetical protein
MEIIDKIVDFEKYCKTCKYKDTKEFLDPCHDCLNNPTNVNSQKPVNYKEKEKKEVKKENKK